jgi:uncharacterized protein YndB with AHSA1/START domain
MRIALIIVGAVVALVLVVVLTGYSLPVRHRATAEATVKAPPDQVFSLITNVDAFPTWRTGVTSVKALPSADGKRRFREVSSNGAISYLMETVDPPHRLVTRIDDTSLPFGGAWTYEVVPSADRATLRITEDGEIYNPVFRFVSRFFLGYDGTIKKYLADVQRKLTG